MGSLQRLQHSGNAVTTGLLSSITAVSTTCTLVSAAGWPDGSTGPFAMKIDAGQATEEKILCQSRSGTTVTFAVGGRGYDNTSAAAHGTGTSNVEHCFLAAEADDANRHMYKTTDDDHTQYARTDGTRAITGAQSFSSSVTVASGVNVTAGGVTVTAGGATVSAGGAAITGDSTVTGNLTVSGALTVGGAAMLPAGTMMDYAGSAAPTGWLLCDGSAVSRTTYASLFSAIGTAWGVGNGTTTFNVPDLRGRTAIGAGTGSGLTARTLAGTGGEETHQLTTGELASHSHTITDQPHSHSNIQGNQVGGTTPGWPAVRWDSSTEGTTSSSPTTRLTFSNPTGMSTNSVNTGITGTNTAGTGTAHNNMQPFAVVTKIIKT